VPPWRSRRDFAGSPTSPARLARSDVGGRVEGVRVGVQFLALGVEHDGEADDGGRGVRQAGRRRIGLARSYPRALRHRDTRGNGEDALRAVPVYYVRIPRRRCERFRWSAFSTRFKVRLSVVGLVGQLAAQNVAQVSSLRSRACGGPRVRPGQTGVGRSARGQERLATTPSASSLLGWLARLRSAGRARSRRPRAGRQPCRRRAVGPRARRPRSPWHRRPGAGGGTPGRTAA